MTDRPIIFSAPMVRALLEGRKTQTRRILEPQPNMLNGGRPMNNGMGAYSTYSGWKPFPFARCDRLWVRETWCGCDGNPMAVYKADDDGKQPFPRWKSPIYMPKWASRLTLIVTDVRVQRLQEISKPDAISEGSFLGRCACGLMNARPKTTIEVMFWQTWCHIHGDEYISLWNTIHGPDAWDANPWVVALTFDMRRGNIDAVTP